MDTAKVRLLVEVYYDVQQVRVGAQNRVRAAATRGLAPESEQVLLDWLDSRMEKQERELKAMVLAQIKAEPIWEDWLKGVKGIGPCIAGGLMAWAGDCSRFDTVSKLWAYSGQHVVDGAAPRRKAGQKANWNPTMRTLCWKAGKSFVMVGDGYRAIYDAEKARLRVIHPVPVEYDPPRKTKAGEPLRMYSDGHVDAMARRKTVKLFLSHYWEKARTLAGLPVREPYALEQMGHTTRVAVVTK
jgi:hypothetical protein